MQWSREPDIHKDAKCKHKSELEAPTKHVGGSLNKEICQVENADPVTRPDNLTVGMLTIVGPNYVVSGGNLFVVNDLC